jgi:hypothetical protein
MRDFKMSGWIKLHRKLTENPLYFSEPFSRSMAWIDMLLIANHSDNYFFKRGIRVDVKVGQIGYDLDSLGKRWKWSRGKVERFILMLENDKQIVRQKTNVTTLISIVNYKEYQTDDKPNSKPNSKANDKPNGNKQECKELKEEIYIPELSEFLEYAVQQVPSINKEDVKLKYESWKVNDWSVTVNNKTRKIVNWKSTLLNTLPYLRKDESKIYTPNIIHE